MSISLRQCVAIGAALFVCIASCSANDSTSGRGRGNNGNSGGATNPGSGGSVSLGGSFNLAGSGGAYEPLEGEIKSSVGPTLTVTGTPQTVQFTLETPSGVVPEGVQWSVDDTRIGSVGSDGVFRTDGYVGGVVKVSATVGKSRVSTEITINVDITENPGAISEPQQTALEQGGSSDPTFKWLYPYDRTVFPRGLPAPSLQFAGTAASATFVKITAPYFNYRQFAGAGIPLRATVPEPVWRGLTLTVGATDDAQFAVSKLSGTAVAGPVSQSFRIAPASLKGAIYYSTYKSPLAKDQAAILRIRPGNPAELIQSGCTVCHTVSANGNVLAAGLNFWANGAVSGEPDQNNPTDSGTFNLVIDGAMTQRTSTSEGRNFAFAALTPDGALALTNGLPPGQWPGFIPRGLHSAAGFPSQLLNTQTGAAVAASGLGTLIKYAQSPAFSPDAKHVAFINGDRVPAQRVLSVMDFDATSNAFSNLRDVVNLANAAGSSLAWPSFIPDGLAVVYHEGDSFDSSKFLNPTGPAGPQYAELRLADIATGTVKTLNALNGKTPTGDTYLPFGAGEEGKLNYEPSVLPVPVGGYYWVLFTSRRAYGNTIAPGAQHDSPDDPFGREEAPSLRKKIWIAAIDVNHLDSPDPSHPAFYLPGQEEQAGNMRAFAALAPCKQNGLSCESGADCCNGYCRETSRTPEGLPVLQCVDPPENVCSNIDEPCLTSTDCCDPRAACINGRCAIQPPPK